MQSQLTVAEKEQLLKLAKSFGLKNKTDVLPPISGTERVGPLPLSFAQQRLWFLAQLEGVSQTYHIFDALSLKGELDRRALRQALDRIVARHEALRTTFVSIEGEPRQRIHPAAESRFHLVENDLGELLDPQEELDRLVAEEAGAVFDLETGPLIRGRLIRLAEQEHALLITIHHIVSDGWSTGLLAKELSVLYGAFLRGEEDPLPELGVQYADYAVWQRKWMEGEVLRGQAEYWKRTLAGAPALLELPTDRARPAEQDYSGGFEKLELGKELTGKLKELSQRRGVTLYMTLLAGWAALLSRLSGQDDIVIGTPVANRGRVEIEGLIGFFLNMLTLRLDLSGSPTVDELLERVKTQTLAAQQRQDIPFEQVVEIVQPVRSLTRIANNPLFQVGFSWATASEGELILSGLSIRPLALALPHVARLDLRLFLQEIGEQIVGGLEYATALFERSTIERYLGHLRILLEGMVAADCQTVDRIPILTEVERRRVLVDWNATAAEWERDESIHELFEEQVSKTPEAVVVVFEDASLTHGELNRRANQLAHYLRGLGVAPDARVGICMERSLEMIVGLLGVLKAGGAYVPLDPSYPAERLHYMVKDSAPVAVLTQGHLEGLFSGISENRPVVDISKTLAWREQPETNPDRSAVGLSPERLVYVIYTSGSTGLAKGVMVEHRQLSNYVAAISEKLRVAEGWSYGLVSTFAADLGNTALFPSLLGGGKLHVLPVSETRDEDRFDAYCRDRGVDCLKITPSHFQALLGEEDHAHRIPGRCLVFGGELLSQELVARVRSLRPECRIYNHYGPTECTVGTLSEEVGRGHALGGNGGVPLGRPLGNLKVYILDSQLNVAPIGVVGEIYIGGAGVARGYLERAELTAERFVGDPFVETGARMYRTGDLGRWLADGTIEFLGRNDFQVKIRGYRIELGEIEARLKEHEGVREAVVVAREDEASGKRLTAYIVPDKAHAYPVLQMLRLERSGELPRAARYELPNGMVISHQNKGETEYLYQEIFGREAYLRHGIRLREDACVLDVGANIGLFTLFVLQHAPRARIYAFEPIPPVFETLRINANLCDGQVKVFDCGLSKKSGTASFAWFKHNSLISGRYANLEEEGATIKAFIKNQETGKDLSEEALEKLIRERLEYEQYTCALRTISDVIAAERVEGIDLLKIDVQKSEMDVLEGIEEKDWAKIEQVVVEVHDIEGRLGRIQGLLERQGYQQSVEQDELLEATNQYTIYARRKVGAENGCATASVNAQGMRVYWSANQLETELRAQVAAKLPEYMSPASYVWLERLPLTPNGKIDRKALPAPEDNGYEKRGYEAPMGELETIVARVWAEVLKVERVGRHDNFFELGGNSLLVVRVMARLRRAGIQMDVRSMFATPVLAELSAAIRPQTETIEVPPNLIPSGCEAITPEMLTLVRLTAEEIGRIVKGVPGKAANVQDIYPLAPLQEGILFHHLMGGESDPYVLGGVYSFESRERLEACLEAMQAVIDRHDILRTAIVWEGLSEPAQVVWRKAALPVEEVELEAGEGDAAQQLYARYNPRRYRMDLRQAPLMRAVIAQDAENGRWLMMNLRHHLVGDHTTTEVMQEEIQAHLLGEEDRLPTPLPFRNLVAQARLGVSLEEYKDFFRRLLGDVEEPTTPFGLLNVQGDGTGIEQSRMRVEPEVSRRIREVARRLGVSAASLAHVAWAQVVGRASGREDVVFGTVLFGRMQGGEGAERVMGLFMNTLPVRIRVGGEGVEAVVRRTHRLLADLLRHEHASLALAQRCSAVPAPTPLFSALLNYRHGTSAAKSGSEERRRAWKGIESLTGEGRTNYPLILDVDDLGENFWLAIQVEAGVGAKRVCKYMRQALESLVEALESDPGRPLRALESLPEEERRQLLYEWNATDVEYPRDKRVHEMFEEQVSKTPGAVAVVYEDASLTYGELNRRANQLAHYLRGLGVGPDARVAICLERGLELMEGLLGVLKAGGAYVPLDPAYPVERLRFMLKDSGAVALLTRGRFQGMFSGLSRLPALDLEMRDAPWREQPETNPEWSGIGDLSQSLAYLMYTSGSTGLPKCAMIEHRGLLNHLCAKIQDLSLTSADIVAQNASQSFDISVWQCLAALLVGGQVLIIGDEIAHDPILLPREVDRAGVTIFETVPTMLRAMLDSLSEIGASERPQFSKLRRLISNAEALPAELCQKWFAMYPAIRMLNTWGATECSDDVTHLQIERSPNEDLTSMPLGYRLGNIQLYIVDREQAPVPIGVPGELCIAGVSVGRGYMNDPERTCESFTPDRFSGQSGARLYRTGDLGRYLADGNIEFLGRIDHQVKIRGYRIELGEIEARLVEHDGVREAVVVAREDTAGDRRLVAYYTCAEAVAIGVEDLREHLTEKLPGYMVPAAYVRLERLPLTPNGKVDRKALPKPDGDAYGARVYEAPEGETETVLASIWAEVLKVERVGRRDNFFELGGHSLLVVRVIARLRKRLEVEVTIADLFSHPVLSDLARTVESASQTTLPAITSIKREGPLPLSYAQQRLWFLAQMEGVSQTYHTFNALRLKGELDRSALRRALDRILARHEALRTTFVSIDGEPMQRILPAEKSRFQLVEHDLRERIGGQEELNRLVAQEAGAVFDLENGPVIRGRLIRLGEQESALLITMHHIVSDGWSMGVLAKELRVLYGAFARGEGDPLPELGIQYADYAVWQRKWMDGEVLSRQAEYWERTLAGAPALLDLPTDHARPAMQDYSGGLVKFELEEELTGRLKELSQRRGVTLYMTLLAAWATLLSRLSGQEDVVIGTPVANRGRMEIEGLIGFFVNTLALRVDVSGSPTVRELLGRVKERVLAGQENQDIPFEQVVEIVRPARSLSHSPLFQVMFELERNIHEGGLELTGLEVGSLGSGPRGAAKFDLLLSFWESGERIIGGLRYATALFERSTVERYLSYLHRFLEEMAADDAQAVDSLCILPEAERRLVLQEWNATKVAYPRHKCIHELFEAQVEKNADAIALVDKDRSLTYGELNVRANRLANYLRRLGVAPHTRVAILLERSIELALAELAVLKCGASYLAMDRNAPAARQAFMIEDCRAQVILTVKDLETPAGAEVRRVDIDALTTAEEATRNLQAPGDGEMAACIFYTSGSTGQPKGMIIPHRAIGRLTLNNSYATFETDDRVAFTSNPAFDASSMEVWGPLLHGGCVVVVPQEVLLDPKALTDLLLQEEVSMLHLVAGLLGAYAEPLSPVFPRLRYLLTGGDLVDPRAVAKILRTSPPRRLIHCYGPSESATFATTHEVREVVEGAKSIPIGRPIANTRIYLLDSYDGPAPIVVAGEVCIGGAGLAHGYLNRPDLTAKCFMPDPFCQEPGARMYKTGDLGRWLTEGTIEFLGRNDFQVKIRGYRIELGEIEARLAEHAAIREAIVQAREDRPGEKRLVAYLVPRRMSETTISGSNGWNNSEDRKRMELWPSIGEYFVYDDLIYYGLTNDEPRNRVYQAAFRRAVKDKIVVDIGTGRDAILARLCVEAGAKKVYAIEVLDVSYRLAERRIRELGLQDRVALIHGDATKVQLPEKVDVCVSEIFEAIGGAEGAAAIINSARRFLKEDGVVIPRLSVTKIAAVTLPAEIGGNLQFSKTSGHYVEKIFEQVGYRFDVRLCIKNFPEANIISSADTFEYLDFSGPVEPEYSREVKLRIGRSARLDGFLLWLRLDLGQAEVIDILEGEYAWFPVYLPIFHPGIEVKEGEVIEAICSSELSENGINPDYTIKGRLKTKDGSTIDFAYESVHHKRVYRATPFYELLFKGDVAPIEPDNHPGTLATSLRNDLSKYLPEYMVPSDFVFLERLPLTPNGKLDRQALPAPDGHAYNRREFQPPVGEIEMLLAGIWTKVLKLERIGRHDNFFELGGHSLLAVRAVNLLEQAGINIITMNLFMCPTIESLARLIEEAGGRVLANTTICVREGGPEPPLFLTAPFVEGCYIYDIAPHLDHDIPLYAVPLNPKNEAANRTVEGMATRMARMIRDVQPVGPYRIAGYSSAGILAYEIAAQLIGADQQVGFLGLFDTYYHGGGSCPERASEIEFDDRKELLRLLEVAFKHRHKRPLPQTAVDQLRSSLETMDFASFVQRCRDLSAMPDNSSHLTATQVQQNVARNRTIGLADVQYYARPLTIPVHLFAAQDNEESSVESWKSVVPAEFLRVIPLKGKHGSILRSPDVEPFGKAVSNAIRQAAETSRRPPESGYSPLILLQSGRQNIAPLFCLPGAGAGVTSFKELVSRLNRERAVFGLQPRGLDDELVPHSTVSAAAELYVRAINEIYPQGPINLLGHSFGGWVALQMAQILVESGRTIDSLIIVDSEAPDHVDGVIPEYNNTEVITKWVSNFELILKRPLGVGPSEIYMRPEAEQRELLQERLVAEGLMPRGSDPDVLQGPLRTFSVAIRTPYRPNNPYPGPLKLAFVDDPRLDRRANQRNQQSVEEVWRQWAPNLTSAHCPGNHLTILKPPHVQALADLIQDQLAGSLASAD